MTVGKDMTGRTPPLRGGGMWLQLDLHLLEALVLLETLDKPSQDDERLSVIYNRLAGIISARKSGRGRTNK